MLAHLWSCCRDFLLCTFCSLSHLESDHALGHFLSKAALDLTDVEADHCSMRNGLLYPHLNQSLFGIEAGHRFVYLHPLQVFVALQLQCASVPLQHAAACHCVNWAPSVRRKLILSLSRRSLPVKLLLDFLAKLLSLFLLFFEEIEWLALKFHIRRLVGHSVCQPGSKQSLSALVFYPFVEIPLHETPNTVSFGATEAVFN